MSFADKLERKAPAEPVAHNRVFQFVMLVLPAGLGGTLAFVAFPLLLDRKLGLVARRFLLLVLVCHRHTSCDFPSGSIRFGQ